MTTLQGDVTTLLNGRVVKSVQRGDAVLQSVPGMVQIPISAVNPEKAFVIVYAGSGDRVMDGTSFYVYSALLQSASLNVGVGGPSNYTVNAANISWQGVEFY